MSEKPHADGAGPVTPGQPPLDPFGKFDDDDYRLKAVESRHEAAKVIATTQAWVSVGRLAILAFLIGVVLVCAMALGVPPPWELALSLFLGKAPDQ